MKYLFENYLFEKRKIIKLITTFQKKFIYKILNHWKK